MSSRSTPSERRAETWRFVATTYFDPVSSGCCSAERCGSGLRSLARAVVGFWTSQIGGCEDRCFSDRVTELASTRPLYIRDRDWVGGVVVVETMGVENPFPPPPSRVTLFPRSRVSSTTDNINISFESNLFSLPNPLPLPHETTPNMCINA